MYKLVITARAESHTIHICNYYEEQWPGLSDRFLEEFLLVYNKIAKSPQYYSYILPNEKYWDVKLGKFPYVVVFEIYNDEVIVLTVLNTRQETKF